MGSEIAVKSKVNVGSEFYFTIRFKLPEERIINLSESLDLNFDKDMLTGKRALVVDDNEINRKVLKKFLTKWKMVINEAEDGREAIEKTLHTEYSIILMDVHMPDLNGYQAATQIRNHHISTPILAISADVNEKVKKNLYASGMNGFISKPFDPKELFEKLKVLISRKEKDSTELVN